MPKVLSKLEFDPEKYHRQCKTCFMTGKACIYQRNIQKTLRTTKIPSSGSERTGKAFMLMPFRSTLDEVYRAQIDPCLKVVVKEVSRADDVNRTGYVICEKICKQIQESQIVCAELSCDNANVFYELGLAYAMDKNIALFIQSSVKDSRGNIKRKLSLNESQYNEYNPFDMLYADNIQLWKTTENKTEEIAKDNIFIMLSDTTPFTETIGHQNLPYSIDGLCRGAIHRALDEFTEDSESPWAQKKRVTVTVEEKNYSLDGKEITFKDVEEYIRNSVCVIIGTSNVEPSSYFWLGFAHGLEKEVIPITVLFPRPGTSSISISSEISEEKAGSSDKSSEQDEEKPFDVRALWHIHFSCNRPRDLENQLHGILDIIVNKNKDIENRSRFWQPFIDEGNVSIFVGSVELTQSNRHVVGEWDYRTVSELTSFFSSIKETMETNIQTPTFQASVKFSGLDIEKYTEELETKIAEGNSIILASADVNDMTEVALAKRAGYVPFQGDTWKESYFYGIVAFKGSNIAFFTPSLYFQEIKEIGGEPIGDERGFFDIQGGNPHKDRTFSSPYQAYDAETELGYSTYFGHLAKFRLKEANRWTVVIQGITGPATLGVAQVLTGGVYEQFTIFDKTIDEAKRASLLQNVSKESKTLRQDMLIETNGLNLFAQHSEHLTKRLTQAFKDSDSVEAIVKIYIMDGSDQHHDERKIIWWDLALEPRQMAPQYTKKMHRANRVTGGI